MLGLKSAFKDLDGASLSYRLKHIRYELKYAWQRAWRGYDDSMVFDIDYSFIDLYREIFKDFKENLDSFPSTMTEEEWDDILDEMISCLDCMYHVLFESDNDDADLVEQEKNRFFKLFKEHFWSLWD